MQMSVDQSVDHYDLILVELACFYPFTYFWGGELINSSNREYVDLSILLEAGCIVSIDKTVKAAVLADLIVVEYKKIVNSLRQDIFISSNFHDDIMQRLHEDRRDGFKAKVLWMKWQTTLTLMKIFTGLLTIYHTMKLGQQFHNVHEKMIKDQYKTDNVSDLYVLLSLSPTNFDCSPTLHIDTVKDLKENEINKLISTDY